MILESKLKIPKEEIHIIDKPKFEGIFKDNALPCIAVQAMSGFGKTAVCAGAARKHQENVRWYTLDMTDNEEECFLACMEGIWKTVDGKTADAKENSKRRVLKLAYRAQQWDSRSILHIVLDNLQAVSSEEVLSLLSLLQQYVEGRVCFVLITNKRLPKFFLPLLVKGKGRVLSGKHLQLTTEEVCRHFTQGGDLAEEVLVQITRDLCGWPAGIRCVAQYLRSAGQSGRLNWDRILQESLLSAYMDDILGTNCTKGMQSFLKQVAVFDEFSWEMCQEILLEQITREDFEEMLSGLAFFDKVPDREDAWRCSKSFRVYLCRMLPEGEKRELYKRAALWYQERKNFVRLSDYATRGNLAHLLVTAIERYGVELLRKENQGILGEMIDYLEKSNGLPYLEDSDGKRLEALEGQRGRGKGAMLEIHSFGTFRAIALRDGKELAWRTRKGRELFAYFLDIGGRAVERRQLIEALWQDEIPTNAVAMLHNMIYNIRKELSAYSLETILTYENRRYRLSMDGMSCDVWHIQQMAALVEKKDTTRLKEEYKNFLEYWGGYLGDIDCTWVEGKRAYYDEIYKKGCWMLAGQFAAENNYETALVFYENILLLEPYSEKAVEKILLLYGRQKKWEKLRKCYQNFVGVLKRDLGIVPGKEVLAAYRQYFARED